MKTLKKSFLRFTLFYFFALQCFAQVNYDEGRLQIDGIQLLQDSNDENAYYYLTRFVKLSTKEDGTFEFLCIKYVGKGKQESGGIFHALIEFSLPQDIVDNVEVKLKTQVGSKARIVGPVPLRQLTNEDESSIGKFDVVSSILTNTEGKEAFTKNVITSGFAPLLPNSKAAIAAKLTPAGTTLLWNSLSGPTSDVSVSIHGYYEAKVKSYNAIISADASTVYNHFSEVTNIQGGYIKDEIRDITNEMIQNNTLNVEIFDRSEGLGVSSKNEEKIVDIVTEKLIELMFNTETGWASKPKEEVAVASNQVKGRQERGWFSEVFGGAQNTPYFSDDQHVIKKRKDIRTNTFYLNLSKSTTIKVPIHTSGNIAGIYKEMKDDKRYFRVVNLNDTDYQKRTVHFQIDGGFSDAFNEILNSVSVSFRKSYGNNKNDSTSDLLFTNSDLKKGKDFKAVYYPRLGLKTSEWLNYDYKIRWNLKGVPTPITIPIGKKQWISSNSSLIALVPPFKKMILEVDADRASFNDSEIQSASIRFFTILNGKPVAQRTLILRETDAEATSKINLYYDEKEPMAYQVTWYGKLGEFAEPIQQLEQNYLFLITPALEKFKK